MSFTTTLDLTSRRPDVWLYPGVPAPCSFSPSQTDRCTLLLPYLSISPFFCHMLPWTIWPLRKTAPQPHLTIFPKFLQRHRATFVAVFPHRYLWDDISRPFSISVINKFHWWLPICCRQRSVCGVELCTPAATHQNNKNLHLDPPSRHHAKLLMHRGSHRIICTLPK